MKKLLAIAAVLLMPSLVVAQGFVGVEQTPIPMVTIQLTAVPTAFPTPQYIATPTDRAFRTITVDNSSGSAEIWCAFGGSTSPHFSVPAGGIFTDNFGDRGFVSPRSLACINPTAGTASTGTVKIYGSK